MDLAKPAENEVLEELAANASGADHKHATRRDFPVQIPQAVCQETGSIRHHHFRSVGA